MKMKLWLLCFFLFLGLQSPKTWGNTDAQLQAELEALLSQPAEGMSPDVWRSAWSDYLSNCSEGSCECVLVIADGSTTDKRSVKMWLGTLGGGELSTLWTGWGSRLLPGGKEDEPLAGYTDNVSMALEKRCARRNGEGTVRGDQVCVRIQQGTSNERDSCAPLGTYREYMDSLGIPESAGYSSFYFSHPMTEETYKFHDFWGCSQPPCPRTRGCLGLEKHAMKALCLNHMGSLGQDQEGRFGNGFEEPRKGGAWLYYHNTGSPGSGGNPLQGYRALKNGTCSDVSRADLSTGGMATSAPVGGESRGSRRGGSSGGGDPAGMMSMMGGGAGQVNQIDQDPAAYAPGQQDDNQALIEDMRVNCINHIKEACEEVRDTSIPQEYCEDSENFTRNGCEFERVRRE